MPIRKSNSRQALDPNHNFGLPLYQTYYEGACLLLEQIELTVSKSLVDKQMGGILRVSAQSSLLPALFLVRHTIELMLKEVLSLKDLASGTTTPQSRNFHDLRRLWCDLKQAATEDFAENFKAGGVALSTLLLSIETPIQELHLADKSGTTFRYSEALQDQRLFPVNVRYTRKQMDAVIDRLRDLELAYIALIDHNNGQ